MAPNCRPTVCQPSRNGAAYPLERYVKLAKEGMGL